MPLPNRGYFAPSLTGPIRGNVLPRLAPAPAPTVSEGRRTTRRDTEIKDDITNLKDERKLYTQSVDLPSVNANTTTDHDLATVAGTCTQGDYVEYIGGSIANHGYIVLGTLPCPSDNTIRLRVANNTAGAINPVATTLYFVIHKHISVL